MDAGILIAIIGTGVTSVAVTVGALWAVYIRLDNKIESVRTELHIELERLRLELRGDIARLDTKLDLHLREDHGIRKMPQGNGPKVE